MRRDELRIVAPLVLMGVVAGIAQTAILPALPAIQRDFGASTVAVTSLFSVFFVSGAVGTGIFGRLGDMFGKRRLILVQIGVSVAGFTLSALAPNLALMIVGRALAGAASGFFPLAFSLLRDELPAARAASGIGLISGGTATAGIAGTLIGGVLSDRAGYRTIFWLSAGLFAFAGLALFALVRESPYRPGGRVDVLGALLLAAGLAAPLWAISNATTYGWLGAKTLLLVGVGVAVLVVFGAVERRVSQPLIDLPTLLLPQVRMTNAVAFLVGFGMFGTNAIFTQFVQAPTSSGYGFGVDGTHASLFLLPGGIAMLAATPTIGGITRRFGARATVVGASAVATAGLVGIAAFHSREWMLYCWPVLLYMAIMFAFGALPLLILQAVPPELRGQSTSVNLIVRTVGTGIGLQVAATLVTASARSSGFPAERGYVDAYVLYSCVAGAATLLALRLPRFDTTEKVRPPRQLGEGVV